HSGVPNGSLLISGESRGKPGSRQCPGGCGTLTWDLAHISGSCANFVIAVTQGGGLHVCAGEGRLPVRTWAAQVGDHRARSASPDRRAGPGRAKFSRTPRQAPVALRIWGSAHAEAWRPVEGGVTDVVLDAGSGPGGDGGAGRGWCRSLRAAARGAPWRGAGHGGPGGCRARGAGGLRSHHEGEDGYLLAR